MTENKETKTATSKLIPFIVCFIAMGFTVFMFFKIKHWVEEDPISFPDPTSYLLVF